MATVNGSLPPTTYTCSGCGGFMWTEGTCQPCQGVTNEDAPNRDRVTYKYEDGKVIAKDRPKIAEPFEPVIHKSKLGRNR